MRALLVTLRSSPLGSVAVAKSIADLCARAAIFVAAGVILRYEGTDGWGAWSQLVVFASLVGPIAAIGLGHAVVPLLAPLDWGRVLRRELGRLLMLVAVGGAIMAATVALLADVLPSAILDWPRAADLFRVGGLLVGVVAMESVLIGLLQARGWFRLYITFQLLQSLVAVTLAATLLPLGLGLVGLLAATVSARLVIAAGIALVVLTSAASEQMEGSTPPPMSRMIRFGATLAVADLSGWVVQLVDRLVYGHFGTAKVLGAYAAVYAATGLLTAVGTGVFLPAYPRLALARARGGTATMTAAYRSPHRMLAFGVIPVGVYLLLFTLPILRVLVAAEPVIGTWPVVAVVAAVTLSQWSGLSQYVLIVEEGASAVRRPWIAGAVVSSLGALVLIPPFGIGGAAASTIVSYVVVYGWLARRAARWIDVRSAFAWATTVRATLVAGALAGPAGLGIALVGDTLPTLAALSVAYFLAYLAAMSLTEDSPVRVLSDIAVLTGTDRESAVVHPHPIDPA